MLEQLHAELDRLFQTGQNVIISKNFWRVQALTFQHPTGYN
jgi:hypothetical protein